MINYISFPGLGIEEMKINRVAFEVFGNPIYWYGVITVIAIVIVFTFVLLRGKREGLIPDDTIDFVLLAVPLAVIGARVYEILTNLDDYHTLKKMLDIRSGGLSIYGVLIGAIIGVVVIARIKKVRLLRMLDIASNGTLLAQSFGRWENFVNAECYGSETTLPWRMGIRPDGAASAIYVHPTFLYESIWNLIGFILITLLHRKKKFDGQIFLMYFCWYGLGRGFIEILRQHTSDIELFGHTVKANSLMSFILLGVCSIALVVLFIMRKKGRSFPVCSNGTPIYYPGAKHYEMGKALMESYDEKGKKIKEDKEVKEDKEE